MIRLLALGALVGLTACGVDGPPLPVTSNTTGITLSGEAKAGVEARF